QRPNCGSSREADDPFAFARVVQYGLVVALHRTELLSADVEGVVDALLGQGNAEVDGVAQVLYVEELVAVLATADHGEVMPLKRPIVENGEHDQSLRDDVGFGSDDRYDQPFR